jgi:lysozyme family protein
MADYKKLKPIILKWEGGWANDPADSGGCTMKGITIGTFRAYFGRTKTCNDLKKLTDNQWDTVFINGYWNKWLADKINNQSIANLLVDWFWTSGKYGIKYPQQVLGVTADGVVGPKTIAAINDYPNQKELFDKLWNRRKRYFEAIAKGKNQKFLKGWLNRLNDFKYSDK